MIEVRCERRSIGAMEDAGVKVMLSSEEIYFRYRGKAETLKYEVKPQVAESLGGVI